MNITWKNREYWPPSPTTINHPRPWGSAALVDTSKHKHEKLRNMCTTLTGFSTKESTTSIIRGPGKIFVPEWRVKNRSNRKSTVIQNHPNTLVQELTPLLQVASGMHPPAIPSGSKLTLGMNLGLPSAMNAWISLLDGYLQVQDLVGSRLLDRTSTLGVLWQYAKGRPTRSNM